MMLKIEYPYASKISLNLYLMPYAKINSKWSTNLKVKQKAIKLVEDKEESLHDLLDRQRTVQYDTNSIIHKEQNYEL